MSMVNELTTTAPQEQPLRVQNVTSELAHHVTSLSGAALPDATLGAARRLLLDGIGCLIAGTAGGPGQMAYAACEPNFGDAGHSTVFIGRRKASPRDAALVNGITLYSVGLNDLHKPSGAHPGGCVIPALLSVAEWQRSRGLDILAAMVAGYDMIGRVGRAMMPGHRDRGFHPTGTFGPFGSVAAAGRLLGLDAARMTSAIGIASSHAAGVKAFHTDGSLTMVYHAGRAAADGVTAAMFARAGFTGPRTAIEDAQGFAAATSDSYNLALATEGLGSVFEVENTTFRPYYGCGLTIGASGALAEILRRAKSRSVEVDTVEVRSNQGVVDEVSDNDPQTLLSARLSMQFNLALVAQWGDVFGNDVTEEDLHNPRIRRRLDKVLLVADNSLSRYECVVTVRFSDGSEDRVVSRSPKGDPANTLDWDETVAKFHKLVDRTTTKEAAEEVVACVANLEESDGERLSDVISKSLMA